MKPTPEEQKVIRAARLKPSARYHYLPCGGMVFCFSFRKRRPVVLNRSISRISTAR